MITSSEFAILVSGFIIFGAFPWFWRKSIISADSTNFRSKKNILNKLPFLGALISLTLYKNFGLSSVSALFIVIASVQLVLIIKNRKNKRQNWALDVELES